MRLAVLAATALTLVTAHAAHADELDDLAESASVDVDDLRGALSSQPDVDAREYLIFDGRLQAPVRAKWPSGRLACIAWVESHNDPNATNPYSKAAGLFQFLWSTWMTTPQGKQGLSPYDPSAATAAAEWMVSQGRIREWVAVSGGFC